MKDSAHRRLAAWIPAAGWAVLIFVLSAQPNLRFEQDAALDFIVRKTGHMAVFGVLALLLWWAIARTTPWRPAWAWAAALAVGYAVTDELHQGFTAGRHPAISDVAIDAAGVAVATGIAMVVVRRQRRAS